MPRHANGRTRPWARRTTCWTRTAATSSPSARRRSARRIAGWHEALADAPLRVRTAKGAGQHRTRAAGGDEESRRARRSTANRVLTTLKAALNRAWQDGHVASDEPWRRVRPFKGAD